MAWTGKTAVVTGACLHPHSTPMYPSPADPGCCSDRPTLLPLPSPALPPSPPHTPGIARPTGIGHACAHLLHQQGYNIIGIDTLAPPAGTAAPQPTAAGAAAAGGPLLPWRILQQQQQQEEESAGGPPSCVFLQVDLSQPAAILQDIPQQLQGLGVASVKTLVNNAGIADPYLPPPAADGSNAGERAALWSKYIAGKSVLCCM